MHDRRGFTLVEILVTLAVLGILMAIGMPALQNTLRRNKLDLNTNEAASLLRLARLASIRQSAPVHVEIDLAAPRIFAWVDRDRNAAYDPALDRRVGQLALVSGVVFWGPADPAALGDDAVVGFERLGAIAVVLFEPDGSVDRAGALRFADRTGNFIEVAIEPPATARVIRRKWHPAPIARWRARGEAGEPWQWF